MLTRKMKDSGIEWIGEIPEEWELKRNKNLYKEINERTETGKEELLSVSEYYGVKPRKSVLKSGETYSRSKNLVGYKMCEKNDLVMNIMLAWKKSLGVTEHNGIVSPAYAVYRPLISDIFPRYFHYLFRTDLYASYFKSFSTGIIDSRLRLYPDKFLSLYSHFPSVDIQNKIVLTLDQKVGNIEKLIIESKISIEELKKYKQSLITEAVTKGLDPNVEMKDSGIEWVEKIPKQWKPLRIKYVLFEKNDKSITGAEEPLSMSQVHGIIPSRDMENIPNAASSYTGYRIVDKDDLVFNKLKAHLGVFDVSNYYGLVSPDYAVYKAKENYLVHYLNYLFKTSIMISEFIKNSRGVGAGLTRLYTNEFFNIKVPLPNIEEQQRIVSYLDEKSASIDKLIEDKTKVIEELEVYKKSLIYEYVTGKKEV